MNDRELIANVKALNLRRGTLVVVNVSSRITAAQADRIRNQMAQLVPGHRVAVMSPEVRVRMPCDYCDEGLPLFHKREADEHGMEPDQFVPCQRHVSS